MTRLKLMVLCGGLATSFAEAAVLESYDLNAKLAYAISTEGREQVQQAVTVEAEATVRASKTLLLQLGARFSFDAADVLRPNRDDERIFAHANRFNRRPAVGDSGEIEFRELFLEWQQGESRIRAGRQQLMWSSLDGVSLFAVNPSDFHEFVLNDETERQQPQWGLYFDFPVGSWRLESAALLDSSVHDIPDPGAWFEFTAPQFRFGAPLEQPTRAVDIETQLPDTIKDATYALRASRALGNTRIVFAGLIGNEYEAVGDLEQGAAAPVLTRTFPRRRLAKIGLETGAGSVVFRGELVGQFDKVLNTRDRGDLAVTEVDVLALGVGTDLNLPHDLFMNLQLLLERVRDAPEALVKPERNDLLTVTLQRPFLYNTLVLKWRWFRDLERGDSLSQASLNYSPSDTMTVELLGAWFSGSPRGRFGQFDRQDLIRLTLRYSF